ncbi:MAG TPA: DUF3800 domain-containing protein [Terracidiphilus sp.]|jgi:hypothetical protein
MIIGYFDETRNCHQDFVAVSGYLADESNWDALATDWSVLLKKHQIPYLHTTDFLCAEGIYKELGWKEKEKNDLILSVINEFIDVIRCHTVFGIAIGLDAKKYREITNGYRKRPKPEVFCFERLLRKCVDIAEEVKEGSPLCLLFDDSKEYSMKAYANFSEVQQRHPEVKKSIGLIGFGNDEVIPPLQAADVFAYATQRLQDSGGQNAWLEHPVFSRLILPTRPDYGTMYFSERWDADFLVSQQDNIVAVCSGGPFRI